MKNIREMTSFDHFKKLEDLIVPLKTYKLN